MIAALYLVPVVVALAGPSVPSPRAAPAESMLAVVRLPARYDPARSYPLLVALHGNGGTAAPLAARLAAFASDSLIVAAPQGQFPRGPGFSWFYITADRTLWEVFDRGSVASLTAYLDTLRARYRVGRTYLLGFSQGVSMAYMVALLHPERVQGLVAIGGMMPEVDKEGSLVHEADLANARGLRLFVAHGTSDRAVAHREFEIQRDGFGARGYAVTTLEYAGGHELTDELLAQVRRWLREEIRRP
jgi:phospholipase/carboxylesterase